ncbi:MAG: hypothetical protein GY913_19100 [Proteobacteria bacterium]|nr:hypothetical protein [Pseudomonadota bacterium]MCP4919017.1 hypothetical protein [Pseudomonadota bacterium]
MSSPQPEKYKALSFVATLPVVLVALVAAAGCGGTSSVEAPPAASVEVPPRGVTHTIRTADNMGTLVDLDTGYTSSVSEFMLGEVKKPSVWFYPPSGKVQFIGVDPEQPEHLSVNTLGSRVLEEHVDKGASFLVVADEGSRYELTLVDYVPGAGDEAHFEVRMSWT